MSCAHHNDAHLWSQVWPQPERKDELTPQDSNDKGGWTHSGFGWSLRKKPAHNASGVRTHMDAETKHAATLITVEEWDCDKGTRAEPCRHNGTPNKKAVGWKLPMVEHPHAIWEDTPRHP